MIIRALVILTSSVLIYSCGVSDYINSKKISSAPKYKAPPKTSQCEFNDLRINRVVKYINQYRSQPQTCGGKSYPAAPAIQWNNKLYQAADAHSVDMARRDFFDHQGSDGSSPSNRASNAGYDWKTVAENISAGTDTPEQTIDQWINSTGHCHNMMNQAHSEIGMACRFDTLSEYNIYWTLVLASPRN